MQPARAACGLFAALQSQERRSRRSVAALSAIGRGRASVQAVEERSVCPAHLSPARKPNRSPCFYCVSGHCLLVTLKQRLKTLAPGLTAMAVLEKLATMQMIDVELPTTDDRVVVLSRYTEPEKDQLLLLRQLKLQLPAQPPPKITARSSRDLA
jgi:hypothetical protein